VDICQAKRWSILGKKTLTRDNRFFEQPILNSPSEYPAKHWELGRKGRPTQRIIDRRRGAEFITPIPKPKKRKKAAHQQRQFVFDKVAAAQVCGTRGERPSVRKFR
jgi:type III restriction enzyme